MIFLSKSKDPLPASAFASVGSIAACASPTTGSLVTSDVASVVASTAAGLTLSLDVSTTCSSFSIPFR